MLVLQRRLLLLPSGLRTAEDPCDDERNDGGGGWWVVLAE